jgi:hypothetical protein
MAPCDGQQLGHIPPRAANQNAAVGLDVNASSDVANAHVGVDGTASPRVHETPKVHGDVNASNDSANAHVGVDATVRLRVHERQTSPAMRFIPGPGFPAAGLKARACPPRAPRPSSSRCSRAPVWAHEPMPLPQPRALLARSHVLAPNKASRRRCGAQCCCATSIAAGCRVAETRRSWICITFSCTPRGAATRSGTCWPLWLPSSGNAQRSAAHLEGPPGWPGLLPCRWQRVRRCHRAAGAGGPGQAVFSPAPPRPQRTRGPSGACGLASRPWPSGRQQCRTSSAKRCAGCSHGPDSEPRPSAQRGVLDDCQYSTAPRCSDVWSRTPAVAC